MTRVAVVGGGISGLAAAWELRRRAEVTVYEQTRLGGCILTEPFEGRPVDCGPDAFLVRVPDALALCEELGVADLVNPVPGRTLVWWDGRARELPEGLVLGVPRRLSPLLRSGLLGPLGLVRAAADLILPANPPDGDLSVRDLVARRFGARVADRLVDPLVGGIHAGRTALLSAEATVPQLFAAARSSRSLLLGLRSTAGPDPSAPMFAAPRLGMGRLVEAAAGALEGAGVKFEQLAVSRVAPDGAGWRTEPDGGRFDAVVLAVPSPTAGRLLGTGAPGYLTGIRRASVAVVTMGYAELDLPAGMSGVLVPPDTGMLMTACSFASAKWPHWAAPGRSVLRVSAGRAGDDRPTALDDEALVGRLSSEVSGVIASAGPPQTWRVSRWPGSFPQYGVGHRREVAAAEDEIARRWPGVVICGSSYGGAGVPACIASGRAAGRRLVPAPAP